MMNMFRKDVSEVSSRIYIGRIMNTFGKGTRLGRGPVHTRIIYAILFLF